MSVLLKKILFMITLNSTLLLMLIVGIQNSSNKRKVNLLIGETVNLPISFIIGMSFIAGSLSSSLILNIFSLQKDSN